MRTARRLASGAPLAARINKQTVARLCAEHEPLSEAELQSMFSYAQSRDHHEGVQAFLAGDRKSVAEGKSVSVRVALGGCRRNKQKNYSKGTSSSRQSQWTGYIHPTNTYIQPIAR